MSDSQASESTGRRRGLIRVLSLVAPLLVVGASLGLALTQEQALSGTVVEVEGVRAKIEIEGDLGPRVDDPVEITTERWRRTVTLAGDWRVVEVDGRSVWAEPEDVDDAGMPEVGSTATVRSSDPVSRAELAEELFREGYRHRLGQGGDRDFVRAAELFEEAGETGMPRAFVHAGDMYLYGGFGLEEDEPRGAELYRRACDAGDPWGCAALGLSYNSGSGVERDEERAIDLWRQSCRSGGPVGCHLLATRYRSGDGVDQDTDRARTLFAEGRDTLPPECDAGNLLACAALGMMYRYGWEVEKDLQRAAELDGQACDMGVPAACRRAGRYWRWDHDGGPDYVKARRYYETGCGVLDYSSCASLGYLVKEGRGGPRDDGRAVDLYRKACDGGNARGCTNLGYHYANGRGVREDQRRAVELYRKACDRNSATACNNLAVRYERGRGVAPDPERAEAFRRKACELDEEYCEETRPVRSARLGRPDGPGIAYVMAGDESGDPDPCGGIRQRRGRAAGSSS